MSSELHLTNQKTGTHDSDIAIEVSDVSKCFHVYDLPRQRLQQFILPTLRGTFGLERRNYYREYWALRGVSFSIRKGETVGIVGKNGSGKSTLLQLICGTLTPSQGNIQTHGRIAALLELGSGFNPEFTGLENIYLNGAVLGLNREEIDSRLDDILAFADIGDFVKQPVKTYSSGMAVRLAFAVQTVVDPDIFIVDEALAVGDEKFQRKCFARLEELKGRGASILFVSHSASSVIELCDRALLLNEGRRLLYGEAAHVVKSYQRLIYAPTEKYLQLIDEYQTYDANPCGELTSPEESPEMKVIPDEPQSTEEYDPGLVPESTIHYPEQGAKITELLITSEDGRRVNILTLGKEYKFTIKGHFEKRCESIYFGMHIKTLSGMEITGQRYPQESETIDIIEANQEFQITFSYTLSLQPGTYFAGCGIWSNKEPNSIHRIIDAIMFRVDREKKHYSFGYCDLMSAPPKLEF